MEKIIQTGHFDQTTGNFEIYAVKTSWFEKSISIVGTLLLAGASGAVTMIGQYYTSKFLQNKEQEKQDK